MMAVEALAKLPLLTWTVFALLTDNSRTIGPFGRRGTMAIDRIKAINGFAVLIEGRPFDPYDSLRFSLRWCELDHLALEANHIARADPIEFPRSARTCKRRLPCTCTLHTTISFGCTRR
jgi:hypothetical protein